MSVLEQVKAHFQNQGLKHIDVPEWGAAGTPLRIHYRPITIYERRKIFGGGANPEEAAVDTIILKALDGEGRPLFSLAEREELLHGADAKIVNRVGAVLLAGRSLDEAEKN